MTTGQMLGLFGNTGRTTNPHLHFQVVGVSASGSNTLGGVPMQFINLRALADDDDVNNLGDNPKLRALHGMTLHQKALVMPNPCGLDLPPAGLLAVSRHGVPAECYQDLFNMIVARGYSPKYVDGYDAGGDTYFNASFHAAEVPWLARHGLTGSEYQDVFDEATGNGFRLHQVDSYLKGGQVRYAAIFEQRPGHPQSAFHGLDDDAYGDRVDNLAAWGYVPVQVSTVEVGGGNATGPACSRKLVSPAGPSSPWPIRTTRIHSTQMSPPAGCRCTFMASARGVIRTLPGSGSTPQDPTGRRCT